MIPETQFRQPTHHEQGLLERLLETDFPGRDELIPIMRKLLVRTLDDLGSLEIQSQSPGMAPVSKRIPVEAEAEDEDHVAIHVLLHVKGGQPVELEIFKDDGSPVKLMPSPSAFELTALPPAPQ